MMIPTEHALPQQHCLWDTAVLVMLQSSDVSHSKQKGEGGKNTMRMSDRPTLEADMYITASATRVWDLVTNLQLMGQWSPEYQGGEWLDGATGPRVGARFKGRNKRGEREWESVSTVIAAEAGRSFAWAVGNPARTAEHRRNMQITLQGLKAAAEQET